MFHDIGDEEPQRFTRRRKDKGMADIMSSHTEFGQCCHQRWMELHGGLKFKLVLVINLKYLKVFDKKYCCRMKEIQTRPSCVLSPCLSNH